MLRPFKETILLESAERIMRRELPAKYLDQEILWLASPLGKKINTMQLEASFEEDFTKVDRFLKSLITNPISIRRMKLIEQLDHLVAASKINYQLNFQK